MLCNHKYIWWTPAYRGCINQTTKKRNYLKYWPLSISIFKHTCSVVGVCVMSVLSQTLPTPSRSEVSCHIHSWINQTLLSFRAAVSFGTNFLSPVETGTVVSRDHGFRSVSFRSGMSFFGKILSFISLMFISCLFFVTVPVNIQNLQSNTSTGL